MSADAAVAAAAAAAAAGLVRPGASWTRDPSPRLRARRLACWVVLWSDRWRVVPIELWSALSRSCTHHICRLRAKTRQDSGRAPTSAAALNKYPGVELCRVYLVAPQ